MTKGYVIREDSFKFVFDKHMGNHSLVREEVRERIRVEMQPRRHVQVPSFHPFQRRVNGLAGLRSKAQVTARIV